jgi:hypothetical protein
MVRKCATLVISDFKRIKLLYDNVTSIFRGITKAIDVSC